MCLGNINIYQHCNVFVLSMLAHYSPAEILGCLMNAFFDNTFWPNEISNVMPT